MIRILAPHWYLHSVLELDAARLQSLGIAGLLLDLDGTLKDYRATEIPAAVTAWVRKLRTAGIRLCLLSNGKTPRIARFGSVLEIPFIAKAFKPLPFGCRKGLRRLGLDRGQVAVVGDQVFADVLAGRLAGMRTILVPPTHTDEPWFTRLKRPLERWVVRRWLKSGAGAEQTNSAERAEAGIVESSR